MDDLYTSLCPGLGGAKEMQRDPRALWGDSIIIGASTSDPPCTPTPFFDGEAPSRALTRAKGARLFRFPLEWDLLTPLGTLPARIGPAICARAAPSGPPPALSRLPDLPRAPAARAAAVGAPRVRGVCGVLNPLIGAARGAFIRPRSSSQIKMALHWSGPSFRPSSRTRWSREERTDPEARGTISRPQ